MDHSLESINTHTFYGFIVKTHAAETQSCLSARAHALHTSMCAHFTNQKHTVVSAL